MGLQLVFGQCGSLTPISKKIQEYIRNQLKEDLEYDQMTLREYIDPFTGEPVVKGENDGALASARDRSAEGELFRASLEASREQRLIATEETTG